MPGLSTHEELILLRKRARRRLVGAIVLVLVSTVVLWKVVGSVPEQQMKPESVEIVGQKASEAPSTAASPNPEAAVAAGADGAPPEEAADSAAAATQLPAKLDDAAPAPVAPSAPRPPAVVPETKSEAKTSVKEEPKPHPKAEARLEPKPEPRQEPKKTEAPAPKKSDPAAILEGRAEAEPAKAAAKEQSQPAAGNGNVVIQLAALSDPAKAEALKSRLSALGVTAHFSKVETSKGNVTRVRVGPFGSRAEAESVLKKLSSAGVTGIIVSR